MAHSELVQMLDLETAGDDRFVGQNLGNTNGVIFGGQLLAQTISAAARCAADMRVKSAHTVFVRGGLPEKPIELEVGRLHAGRSFASIEVSIRQGDRLCTRSLILLDRPDPDLINHATEPPAVAGPDQARPSTTVRHGWEVRFADGADIIDPDAIGPPALNVWSRFEDVAPDEWVSQALLGYASDGFLIGTAMRPHPGVGQALAHVSISTSVITQTLTFHERFDAGEWLLLAHQSPYAGSGRSFGRADAFTVDGRLVASYAQENMIRALAPDRVV
jgi:acyl-CoA thioesterase II